MTQTWHISKLDDTGPVIGALIKLTPPYTVTIKEGEEPRRDRQNAFAFQAYSDIAKILRDRDPMEVRAETKLHIGVPIMREENEQFRAQYDRLIRPMDYEDKLALMVEPMDFPVTRMMNVKQMSRYITNMLRHWDARGAVVMMPEGL